MRFRTHQSDASEKYRGGDDVFIELSGGVLTIDDFRLRNYRLTIAIAEFKKK